MDYMQTLLILCPLVFLAGFVDAIAGGGGLIALPAYLFAGLPAHTAIGSNKLSSCSGLVAACYKYFKEKNNDRNKQSTTRKWRSSSRQWSN